VFETPAAATPACRLQHALLHGLPRLAKLARAHLCVRVLLAAEHEAPPVQAAEQRRRAVLPPVAPALHLAVEALAALVALEGVLALHLDLREEQLLLPRGERQLQRLEEGAELRRLERSGAVAREEQEDIRRAERPVGGSRRLEAARASLGVLAPLVTAPRAASSIGVLLAAAEQRLDVGRVDVLLAR